MFVCVSIITLVCISECVPVEVYNSAFIMCWDFINLNMYMKEGPLLKPCQKRFRISCEGISIQMQLAWGFCFVFNLWSDLGLR